MESTAKPRRVWPGRLLQALALIFIGPWWVYLVNGLIYGFADIESGFRGFTLSFAYWLGLSLVAVVIGLAIVFFRPLIAWIAFAIVGAFLGYTTGSLLDPTDPKNRPIGADRAADQASPRVMVTVATEHLPPDKANAEVTPQVVEAMNAYLLQDFNQRHVQRGRPITTADGQPFAKVGTLRFEDGGHVLYLTELRPTQPEPGETPVLRMLWNIHDGQLKRVFCATDRDDFTWRAGECGQQLAKTFAWEGWHQK